MAKMKTAVIITEIYGWNKNKGGIKMATNLTQMPNSFCPDGCEKYKPEIQTTSFFSNGSTSWTSNILSCKHEEACKMWNDKINKMEADNGAKRI